MFQSGSIGKEQKENLKNFRETGITTTKNGACYQNLPPIVIDAVPEHPIE